jgi:hypothetical protein
VRIVQALPDFFISRAGADAGIASVIGRILEQAGHRVVLQQWDFANRNFMDKMHEALSSGARVIALLSNDYLASEHTRAEWLNAIAHDPLNTKGRLILLRVGECTPAGSSPRSPTGTWCPCAGRRPCSPTSSGPPSCPTPSGGSPDRRATTGRAPRPVLHAEIRATPGFTGRVHQLEALHAALWRGETAAVTQPAAVHGLGGIGMSTLAREYAWRERDRYAGVWWLGAGRPGGAVGFEGIEKPRRARRHLHPRPGAGAGPGGRRPPDARVPRPRRLRQAVAPRLRQRRRRPAR